MLSRIKIASQIRAYMPDLSDGERSAALALLEAGAASQKLSLSEYVQQTFPNGIFDNYAHAQNVARQQGVEINGAVAINGFGKNARAVIYASQTADFSTWCHELAHIWQAQLSGNLKTDAETAFHVQNGNWQESIYTFEDGQSYFYGSIKYIEAKK